LIPVLGDYSGLWGKSRHWFLLWCGSDGHSRD